MTHSRITSGNLDNNSSINVTCYALPPYEVLPSFDNAAFINRVAMATILSILILPTIFLNCSLLIAISKNKRLWRSTHILIGFLAVTDVLVGVVSMPLFLSTIVIEIIYERNSYNKGVYCGLSKAALNAGDLGLGLSFITFVLITFERYVAIFAPFWYRKYVRKSVMVKATLLAWLIWAAIVVLLILDVSAEFVIGVVLLIVVVMVYFLAVPAHARIFYLLKKMESSRIQERNNRPRIDRKGSITCAILLLCLVLCYVAGLATVIVIVTKGVSSSLLTYCLPWSRVLFLSNSFFNPIIYISRVPLVGRSTKNIFKWFFNRTRSQTTENEVAQSVPGAECGVMNGAAAFIAQDSKLWTSCCLNRINDGNWHTLIILTEKNII